MRYLFLLLLSPLLVRAAEFQCGGFNVTSHRTEHSVEIRVGGEMYVLPRNGGVYELGTARIQYVPVFGVETMVIEIGPKIPPNALLMDAIRLSAQQIRYRCVSSDAVSTKPWKELR